MIDNPDPNAKPFAPPALDAADRLAIYELLSLHGHVCDDGGAARLDELFTDDAVYDVEDLGFGTHRGLEALRALMTAPNPAGPVAHHITNVVITPAEGGAVRARSKGLGVLGDGRAGSVVYDDTVVRTPRGFRIARRVVIARRAAAPGSG